MSVCRFWWDGSDVYVYGGSAGWVCCGCRLAPSSGSQSTPVFPYGEEQKVIDHLLAHVEYGHTVPTYAFASFDAEHPNPEAAKKAKDEWFNDLPKKQRESIEEVFGPQ